MALLPAFPLAMMLFAFFRWVHRLDELKQRACLEAVAFSAVGTSLITFSYGFLESVGWPPIHSWCVWGIMGPLWLVGLVLAKRRYE